MNSVRKLARLESEDRWLLLEAGLILIWIRLSLWMLPWRRAVAAAANLPMPTPRRVAPLHAAWAIRNASRLVPGATCLTRALALQYLLNRVGHAARLSLGVTNGAHGFVAHAWVEYEGEPLLDEPEELENYARLLTMDRL